MVCHSLFFCGQIICFACRFGYPKCLKIGEGSQLMKGCKEMIILFTDLKQKLSVEDDVDFSTCLVGAHFVHGRV